MALVLSHFRMFHDHIPVHVRSALYKVGAVVGGVALVVKIVGYVGERKENKDTSRMWYIFTLSLVLLWSQMAPHTALN